MLQITPLMLGFVGIILLPDPSTIYLHLNLQAAAVGSKNS